MLLCGCLPAVSFGVGGGRVKDGLVVLHIHNTFCVQFQLCRDKFVLMESPLRAVTLTLSSGPLCEDSSEQ